MQDHGCYKEYSRYLDRFMEFKVYGHAGRPIIIFPCRAAAFMIGKSRNMCNLAACPRLDSGKLPVFTADSIGPRKLGQPRPRSVRASRCRSAGTTLSVEELRSPPAAGDLDREQGRARTTPAESWRAVPAWAAAVPSTSCTAPSRPV